MKDIPKKFVKNCDHVGNNTFIQVKKKGNVYMYRREYMDGKVKSYEVFISKFIAKGTPLPGGAVEKEDRWQYPGTNQFGKTAYDCKSEAHAEERFDELVEKAKNQEEAKEESIRTGKPNKGRKPNNKISLTTPKSKFTMKMLVSQSGLSQPQIYPFLKQWLANGIVTIVDQIKPEGKGRPAMVYQPTVIA